MLISSAGHVGGDGGGCGDKANHGPSSARPAYMQEPARGAGHTYTEGLLTFVGLQRPPAALRVTRAAENLTVMSHECLQMECLLL